MSRSAREGASCRCQVLTRHLCDPLKREPLAVAELATRLYLLDKDDGLGPDSIAAFLVETGFIGERHPWLERDGRFGASRRCRKALWAFVDAEVGADTVSTVGRRVVSNCKAGAAQALKFPLTFRGCSSCHPAIELVARWHPKSTQSIPLGRQACRSRCVLAAHE